MLINWQTSSWDKKNIKCMTAGSILNPLGMAYSQIWFVTYKVTGI